MGRIASWSTKEIRSITPHTAVARPLDAKPAQCIPSRDLNRHCPHIGASGSSGCAAAGAVRNGIAFSETGRRALCTSAAEDWRERAPGFRTLPGTGVVCNAVEGERKGAGPARCLAHDCTPHHVPPTSHTARPLCEIRRLKNGHPLGPAATPTHHVCSHYHKTARQSNLSPPQCGRCSPAARGSHKPGMRSADTASTCRPPRLRAPSTSGPWDRGWGGCAPRSMSEGLQPDEEDE
jgi:hypothetical protein